MDQKSLRQLSTSGLNNVANTRQVEAWCWDYAETTGDARYSGIARVLGQIADTWENVGYLPPDIMSDLNSVLSRELSGVLNASTAEGGAILAHTLREEVSFILRRLTDARRENWAH